MATSDFLPFAGASGANVITQAAYAGSSQQTGGFQSGIAPSANVNKPIRQSAIMAAVLAQFIADQTGVNSVDDGTTATLLANLKTAMPGRLLNVQIFTLGGVYTKTPGTNKVRYLCMAAGASGGGAAVTTSSQYAVGAGGGGGAWCGGITAASNLSGQTVTVGAGGASASSSGNPGGASSIGSFCAASGGFGGSVGLAVSSPVVSAGGSGGLTVSGTYQYWGVGGSGLPGIAFTTGNYISGTGGASIYSAGAPANTTAGQGNVANGYGAGGAGASSSGGSAAQASGPGHAGIVIFEEFA